MKTSSWVAEAATMDGHIVRFHYVDRCDGFLHGYVDGDHTPKCWALDNGHLLAPYNPSYDINLETFAILE